MKRNMLLFIVLFLIPLRYAAAQFPTRNWNDDMARHTFSLNIGPSWFTDNNPVFDLSSLVDDDITPVGFEVALRYDWSYFRGFEVALGTGATYIYSYNTMLVDGRPHFIGDVRVGEAFHYLGANVVNTKMWFGKRTIWDACIHMGYMGGRSWIKAEGHRDRLSEHGFMAGLSSGLDIMVTAWLGVGVNVNVMTGVLYSSGSSSSREYTRASVRFGAVYCF